MPDLPDKLRCFIGIPVDEAIIRRLRKVQDELAQRTEEWIRWTAPEQMHLTLKFLGSVAADGLPGLEAVFHSACEGSPALNLKAETLGSFPSTRNPRVLWVGLGGDIAPLKALQARIDVATSPWAQKAENRAFHPHLTLGRVRENASRHARRIGEAFALLEAGDFGSWRAGEVLLMRSQLSPKGSIYTALATARLG